jgi:hypothetical protein
MCLFLNVMLKYLDLIPQIFRQQSQNISHSIFNVQTSILINFIVTISLALTIMTLHFFINTPPPLLSDDKYCFVCAAVDIAFVAPLLPCPASTVPGVVLNPAANFLQSFDFHASHVPVCVD